MTTKEEVLQQCTVQGMVVKLPNVQLERKLYQEVAKALELIGGKWKGGKVYGFQFPVDPTDLLEEIATGEKRNLKKEYQFFATPIALANEMFIRAQITSDHAVLEPSAGQGAIIAIINKVTHAIPDCYELMEINRIMLAKSGLKYNLLGADFLQHGQTSNRRYDHIIANPPFTKNQDIDHVYHMYHFLKVGGRLVSIVSESAINGSQKKQLEFRKWLMDKGAIIHKVPKGTFKESGTMVGAAMIIINSID